MNSFKNPVYQPIETPTNTQKYSLIFNSTTPQTPLNPSNNDLPIVTIASPDPIVEDRLSAEFGKHSRHISMQQTVEYELRATVGNRNYVACNIF